MKSADLRLLLSWSGSRRLVFVAVIAACVWTALLISSALFLAHIIAQASAGKTALFKPLLYLAFIWILRALFQSTFEKWCSQQAITLKAQLRGELTSQISQFPSVSPAHLSTLLIKGLNSLDIYLGRFLPQLFFAIVTPIFVIATLFVLDPLSALIAILTIPLIPLFGALIGMYTAHAVKTKWASLGTLAKYFEDSLRGYMTLKIFGREKSQSERIATMGNRYTSGTMKVLKISFLSAFALELVATMSVAVVAVSIGLRLVYDRISFVHALAVLILAPEVYFPLRNAASLFHASADGSAALAQLREIQNSRVIEVPQEGFDFSHLTGLSWSAWTLDLAGLANSRIDQADLALGSIHFIVGESGIGKSTFALNLLGVHNGAGVRVHLGDEEAFLTSARKDAWFKCIGWVPQSPQLAAGDIRQQFKLINPAITEKEIITQLGEVGLNLVDLPDGLDSHIGTKGESASALSGGQIRKIALARALISRPKVLIADEPTADLDFESSEIVMKSLREFASSGAIVICITHDISVITPSDHVSSFAHEVRQ